MNYKKILLAFIFFAIAPNIIHAAGIQASPAKMDIAITDGKKAIKEIIVSNPTSDVQLYEASADDFAENFKINPSSFTLESGARKTISVTVEPKNLKNNQVLSTNISIISKPMSESAVNIGTGVKIPVNVTLNNQHSNSLNWKWGIAAALSVLALAVLGVVIYRKKRVIKPQ